MKKIILSCEHGGNKIPREYRYLFERHQHILESHRGWDIGALQIARALAGRLHVPLHFSTTSRLLVELNRSPHHPSLFSEFTRSLSKEEKQKIISDHYFPYRSYLEDSIKKSILPGRQMLHISVHSFTPVLDQTQRNCDIGLLYDPERKGEKEFCRDFKAAIKKEDPELRVRFNYPYLGQSDGMTTYLRQRLPLDYAGIELEINQALVQKGMTTAIVHTLAESLKSFVLY